MSRIITFRVLPLLTVFLLVAAGCTTPFPPAYVMPERGPELPGPVSAIALGNGQVAAANKDGVFVRGNGGKWEHLEITGLKGHARVTCLAFFEEKLFVGTDGEGLYIYSDGSWEVVNRKYSDLPGDGVLTMAVDGEDNGLPGKTLWVGTHEGIAALRGQKWTMYTPGTNWLNSLPGGVVDTVDAEVYKGARYKMVRSEKMKSLFTPPVAVVAVGPGRVVFANRESRLAIVGSGGVAVVHFTDGRKVRSLAVDENVIWAGTDVGLLWGGLSGKAAGRPWPTNYPQVSWIGNLSGSRDTRPYEYGWFQLGYSTGRVNSLVVEGSDLWVAHASGESSQLLSYGKGHPVSGEDRFDSIVDLRRYLNIGEYILRKEKPIFESYGRDDGLKGEYQKVEIGSNGREIWVGTSKGLYRLER